MKSLLRIGMIGRGFMGRAHSHAWHDLGMFFNHSIEMKTLCGVGDGVAQAAKQYGWQNSTEDWRQVIQDPDIHIVDICTPDHLHAEIAVAAADAGKHVICEKPMSVDSAGAEAMLQGIRENNVKGMCNFVYRGLPALKLARSLIQSGRIGKIYSFTGQYLQDFALSPDCLFGWRMDQKRAGAGIIGDKGAHLIDMARYLAGEIVSVSARSAQLISHRRDDTGMLREVTTPDAAVFMAIFANGALGMFQVSNMCAGRKNAMLLEVNGSSGSICFDLERLNEIRVHFEDDNDVPGFRTVNVTEKYHPHMSRWWPSGHSLGWEHGFIHQFAEFMDAVVNNTANESNFLDGVLCQHVVDAVALSDKRHEWVEVKSAFMSEVSV